MTAWLAHLALAALVGLGASLALRARRPSLAHALCVVGLVALLVPPTIELPVLPAAPASTSVSPLDVNPASPVDRRPAASARPSAGLPFEPTETRPHLHPAVTGAKTSLGTARSLEPTAAPSADRLWFALLAAWALGAVVVLGITITRSRRLAAIVRDGRDAPPTLRHDVAELTTRLGIRRAPRIRLVDRVFPPALVAWPFRTTLVLPAMLVDQLDDRRRRALLAHELAHVRRGDHRVRWLELAATTVWWWLPLTWWLRRTLRLAEEPSCDAWVAWALPDHERAFADALLDTVDFLAEPALELPPMLASSAVGTRDDLERRLQMLMDKNVARGVGRTARLALVACLVTLPFAPTAAARQQDPTTPRVHSLPPEAPAQDPTTPDKSSIQALERRIGLLEQLIRDRDALNRLEDVSTLIQSLQARPITREVPPEDGPDAADLLRHAGYGVTDYKVQAGDSLHSIARRFAVEGQKVDLDLLVKLNGGLDPRRLHVGQELAVPVSPRPVDDLATRLAQEDLPRAELLYLLNGLTAARPITAPVDRDPLLAASDRAVLNRLENARVTYECRDATPEEWARLLQRASGTVFRLPDPTIDAAHLVDEHAGENETVREALDHLTAKAGLTWRIDGGVIVIENAKVRRIREIRTEIDELNTRAADLGRELDALRDALRKERPDVYRDR